jgi:hypothetical protein
MRSSMLVKPVVMMLAPGVASRADTRCSIVMSCAAHAAEAGMEGAALDDDEVAACGAPVVGMAPLTGCGDAPQLTAGAGAAGGAGGSTFGIA